MDKKFVVALLLVAALFVGNAFYNLYVNESVELNLSENNQTKTAKLSDNDDKKTNVNDKKIVVYIEGAIAKPGLVYIDKDARLGEVINLSGGLLANADIDDLNMADKVNDGDKITIPARRITENSTDNSSISSDIININTATAEELQKLPRIGPATAKSIVEYREKHGKFKTIEEIKNVPRIGEKTFEKFKDKIKVN